MRQMPGPDRSTSDSIARDEKRDYEKGELDRRRIAKENEHQRSEKFKESTFRGINRLVGAYLFAVLVAFLVVGVHYVLPSSYAWLDENQLGTLKTFIFSSSLIWNVATWRKELPK